MTTKKARKRTHPYMARARAFWRVAAKKRREGDYRAADWYAYQAQMAHTQFTKMKRGGVTNEN